MRRMILGIAAIYAAYGAISALVLIYQMLFTGIRNDAPGLVFGVICPIAIAHGLATRRNWARVLALVIAAFIGVGGAIGVIVGIGHVAGFFQGASGLAIERPAVGIPLVLLMFLFAAVQWQVFTRPDGVEMFRKPLG